MVERPPISPSERPAFAGFADFVHTRRQEYRQLKKWPWQELSQTWTIPEFATRSYAHALIDHFPPYIPTELVEKLKATRPPPLIETGILVDKRMLTEYEQFKFDLPPSIDANDTATVKAWANGIVLLNEIATDTLTFDVLNRMSQDLKYHRFPWFRPLGLIIKGWQRQETGYEKTLGRLEFFTFGGWEALRQKLIVAMLSGDTTDVDALLEQLGMGSVNELALQIGKIDGYALGATNRTPPDDPQVQAIARVVASLYAKGYISSIFPGVINIPLLQESVMTGLYGTAGLISAYGLTHQPGLAALVLLTGVSLFSLKKLFRPAFIFPHALGHEIIHYYSQDINRTGLRRFIRQPQPASEPTSSQTETTSN